MPEGVEILAGNPNGPPALSPIVASELASGGTPDSGSYGRRYKRSLMTD